MKEIPNPGDRRRTSLERLRQLAEQGRDAYPESTGEQASEAPPETPQLKTQWIEGAIKINTSSLERFSELNSLVELEPSELDRLKQTYPDIYQGLYTVIDSEVRNPSPMLTQNFPDSYESMKRFVNEQRLDTGMDGDSSSVKVGKIDISEYASNHGAFGSEGKNIPEAGLQMRREFLAAMTSLADAVVAGDPVVSDVSYFMGISRLASLGTRLGFDVFRFRDEAGPHSSTGWAREAYERMGLDHERASRLAQKHKKTFAIISREELVKRFTTHSDRSF